MCPARQRSRHQASRSNWQSSYELKEPLRFAAGTRFEEECSYDNSADNPRNPFNPPRHVWHDETINEEMLLPMFTFTSERPLDGKVVISPNNDPKRLLTKKGGDSRGGARSCTRFTSPCCGGR